MVDHWPLLDVLSLNQKLWQICVRWFTCYQAFQHMNNDWFLMNKFSACVLGRENHRAPCKKFAQSCWTNWSLDWTWIECLEVIEATQTNLEWLHVICPAGTLHDTHHNVTRKTVTKWWFLRAVWNISEDTPKSLTQNKSVALHKVKCDCKRNMYQTCFKTKRMLIVGKCFCNDWEWEDLF